MNLGVYTIPQINNEKPKDVNMQLVGLANTGISTNYDAQKSQRSLLGVKFKTVALVDVLVAASHHLL
jgi:hypothetical protein